jgi:hypothetical protein
VLCVVFTAAIGAVITRSRILWGPLPLEDTRNVRDLVFAQTYQAARAVYAPARDGRPPVVLMGNSRIWLAARPSYVEPPLAADMPGRAPPVENIAIFGADIRDVASMGGQVDRMDPALVVVALGTSDLIPDPTTPWPTLAAQVFDLGWRDGPVPPAGALAHVDRWLRTAWPLYRFRELARAAIEDRIVPTQNVEAFPAHFTTTAALFRYMHGENGAKVEAAYAAWRRRPTFAGFVAYLETGSAPHLALVRARAQAHVTMDASSPGVRQLDALLAGLSADGVRTKVVVMPENPLLAEDVRGEFHQPGLSDTIAGLIATVAARHHTPVVDARAWMPPTAFLDFDHLLPDMSGFQTPLAAEIAGALRS